MMSQNLRSNRTKKGGGSKEKDYMEESEAEESDPDNPSIPRAVGLLPLFRKSKAKMMNQKASTSQNSKKSRNSQKSPNSEKSKKKASKVLSISDSDTASDKEDSVSDSSYEEEQEESNSDSDDDDGGKDGDGDGHGSDEDYHRSNDERGPGTSQENVMAPANDVDSDGNVSSGNVSFVVFPQRCYCVWQNDDVGKFLSLGKYSWK